LKLSRVGAVLSLVHSGVEVDKISPVLATKSRLCRKCRFLSTSASTSEWTSHRLALFTTHSALYADLQMYIPAKKIMIYCQKVGRLMPIRAVPPLKVGRLEPSHGDRFRRQWF